LEEIANAQTERKRYREGRDKEIKVEPKKKAADR
jgi:hypothetical protein